MKRIENELTVRGVVARLNLREMEASSGGRFAYYRKQFPDGIEVVYSKGGHAFGKLITDREINAAADAEGWVTNVFEDIRGEVRDRIYHQSKTYVAPEVFRSLEHKVSEAVKAFNLDDKSSGEVRHEWHNGPRLSVHYSRGGYTYGGEAVHARELLASSGVVKTLKQMIGEAVEKVDEYHRRTNDVREGVES